MISMIFFHADMASCCCALKSCLWLCTEQIHKCFFKCAFPSLINVERDFSTALPNVHYSRPNLINCSNSRKTLFQWGNILSFCGQESILLSLALAARKCNSVFDGAHALPIFLSFRGFTHPSLQV